MICACTDIAKLTERRHVKEEDKPSKNVRIVDNRRYHSRGSWEGESGSGRLEAGEMVEVDQV